MMGFHLFIFFFKILFVFREGKGRRKRGRETPICGCLSHAPHWGPRMQPRHVPQTENQTSDLLIHRPALDPLSRTSQGGFHLFKQSLCTVFYENIKNYNDSLLTPCNHEESKRLKIISLSRSLNKSFKTQPQNISLFHYLKQYDYVIKHNHSHKSLDNCSLIHLTKIY